MSLINDWAPHMAIIDIHLSKMNGIDLAIFLKAEIPSCDLILFSGHTGASELLEVARRAGHTFKVLAKPTHPDIFLEHASRVFAPEASN